MFVREEAERAAASSRGKGFLTKLARDTRGNTLAIVGAALVPLAGMIGSGVDMSRAYMAKNRLQNACDAAALAGRRIMQNDTMTTTVENEAKRFFRFNFPQTGAGATLAGPYGTDPVTPTVTRPASGTVRVTAATRIPTTIMSMFGFDYLPLNVTCDASLNFVNTDVMLVLDVTGSMDDNLNGTQKIVALRDAVMAMYDELKPIQDQLEANGMRLRYGVVPYSSSVNVGRLITAVNADYISDSAEYFSRTANYTTATYVGTPGTPETPVQQTYSGGAGISQSDCDKYGRNVSFSGFSPSATTGGGPPPSPTWSRSFSNNESPGVDWGWSGAADTSGSTRSCRRRYTETDTTYETRYRFTNAIYEREDIDVSDFKRGTPLMVVTNDGGSVPNSSNYDWAEVAELATNQGTGVTAPATASYLWNGCIEERETDPSINASSGYAIPPGAHDLNINMTPVANDPETQWRPMLPQLTYLNDNGTWRAVTQMNSGNPAYWACPTEARRLTAWTRASMLSYVNSLTPIGGTYHDIGMIWGARMISSGGIFADSPDTFGGMPVSRHVIFMTDGQLAPNTNTYTSYAVEQHSRRVTGNASLNTQYERHMQRFRMICNATKSLNVSIWVLAFGTSLSPEMLECASNANQASTVNDRNALIARFRQIGSQIGALRLTQ